MGSSLSMIAELIFNQNIMIRLRIMACGSCLDQALKACLFLYLNRHGYNGLCRYNAAGYLNVPFGRYKKPYFPEQVMLFFAAKSKRAALRCEDFEQVMRRAGRSDVVYCDPPYVPRSRTANFTAYHVGGFGEADQLRLALAAKKAAG